MTSRLYGSAEPATVSVKSKQFVRRSGSYYFPITNDFLNSCSPPIVLVAPWLSQIAIFIHQISNGVRVAPARLYITHRMRHMLSGADDGDNKLEDDNEGYEGTGHGNFGPRRPGPHNRWLLTLAPCADSREAGRESILVNVRSRRGWSWELSDTSR